MKLGTFVKVRGLKGVIREIFANGIVQIIYHNGIKPTTKNFKLSQLTEISRDEFIAYCKKRGDTAMYGYLW